MLGNVIDTNTPFIAELIDRQGWKIAHTCHVHDDADEMIFAIKECMQRSDVVLTTGGLGPTRDDITKMVLCEYFDTSLVQDAAVAANVERIFKERGLSMNALTASQAMVPRACRVLPNATGTAPVMWFERNGKVLIAMPGVPREMRYTFTSEVLPALTRWAGESAQLMHHSTLLLEGISESNVNQAIAEAPEESAITRVHVAYLPQTGYLKIRLDDTDKSLLADAAAQLELMFPQAVFATQDVTPAEALVDRLKHLGLTLSTAESCTGGNVAHHITSIAGSSAVYNGSVISYSNEAKVNLLGVSPDTLEQHGAVSEPTALQMAAGALKSLGTTCAIATTGIAGPGGATPGKPVGTVWISIATPDGLTANEHHFHGNRAEVIERATVKGIVNLIRALS